MRTYKKCVLTQQPNVVESSHYGQYIPCYSFVPRQDTAPAANPHSCMEEGMQHLTHAKSIEPVSQMKYINHPFCEPCEQNNRCTHAVSMMGMTKVRVMIIFKASHTCFDFVLCRFLHVNIGFDVPARFITTSAKHTLVWER